jgi:leucine dehydrogenase
MPDAVTDVLRLSRAMSFKHAIAGTGRGGGKAVILADGNTPSSAELMRTFGQFVDSLKGQYVTAEDVGTSVADMLHVRQATAHVAGLPIEQGGSGDPSPMTAYGVFCGIIAALAWRDGMDEQDIHDASVLRDRVIAVQGLGHVGMDLCRQLHEHGARLVVADVQESLVRQARDQFDATPIDTDDVIAASADVFAPCALGGILTAASIDRLGAGIVAGAANNQLGCDRDGQLLHEKRILYAPDFVINAGGIINIANEQPAYDAERARVQTRKIAGTLWQVFARSREQDRPASEVATAVAQQRLQEA